MKRNRNGKTKWGKKGMEKKTEIVRRWREKEGRDRGREGLGRRCQWGRGSQRKQQGARGNWM